MKPHAESNLFQILIFLNSILLSFGISRVFMITNGIAVPILTLLVPIIVVHLLVRLFLDPPLRALISISAIILLIMFLYLLAPQQAMSMRNIFFDLSERVIFSIQYFTGQVVPDNRLLPFAVAGTASLISLIVYATAIKLNLPLLWAIALLAMMTINALRVIRQDPLGIFAASFAILILMVKRHPVRVEGKRRPDNRQSVTALISATPLILAAMIGSLVLSQLLPISLGRQQQLFEGFVDDMSQLLAIPATQELQPDFSISLAGFYPLGTRLGGPVALSNAPVMDVSGHDRTMLLRGAIYERYDGQTWRRDPRGNMYRLDNLLQSDLKKEVFDLDQPDPNVLSGGVVTNLFTESRLTIKPLTSFSSMIFTQGRPVSITPQSGDRFQVHFDDHGMLYSKYPLSAKNVYEVESRLMLTNQPNFSSTVNLAFRLGESGRISREALYSADYLTVPETDYYQEGGQLKVLADQLTAGLTDPYAKALAIRKYLMQTATYNLSVSVPPADQDFVVWFLETKEGYCVYFATAEIVLCRLAGIPARYAEGFILDAPASLNATTTVTAERAHAWCEIYLPFIGWVPVDATPGATAPGDDLANPEVTPVATDPNNPTIETSETPVITLVPEEPEINSLAKTVGIDFLTMLLVGLFLFLIWLSISNRIGILRFPDRLRKLYPDPKMRAEIYWQELQLLLRQDGLVIQSGETPIQFLERVSIRWPGKQARLADTGQIISAVRYGQHIPKETELTMLGNLLSQIEETKLETGTVLHFFRNILLPKIHGVDGQRRLIHDHLRRAFAVGLRFVFKRGSMV